MSLTRMRYLVKELETIVGEETVVSPPPKKVSGFFAMKEELTDLLETAANQMKQRQEQMKLYGRTRLSVTLGIKAQRTLDLAKEKLDALEKQVEKDHTKWISPISDEEYEARQKMCQMMRRLLPDQPVSRKIAAAAKEERASRAASPSSSSSSSI